MEKKTVYSFTRLSFGKPMRSNGKNEMSKRTTFPRIEISLTLSHRARIRVLTFPNIETSLTFVQRVNQDI
jgi:hypothetical protein